MLRQLVSFSALALVLVSCAAMPASAASRDEFPQKRTGTPKDQPNIPPARRGGWVEDHQGLVAASDRDQFPADRRGSGGPVPRAPKA